MTRQDSIKEIVMREQGRTKNRVELAIALHDYVRDHVLFGFTPYFDKATYQDTLNLGVGHCNPQAILMVALFREAGFSARYRPVTINNEILRGAVTTPRYLSHVFTEVLLNGKWLRLDSYIVDPKLRSQAVARLTQEERILGYGVNSTTTGEWDGTSNAYSQVASEDMILDLYEPVDDLEEFYQSSNYRHRFLNVPFSTFMLPARLSSKAFLRLMNFRIERLRQK